MAPHLARVSCNPTGLCNESVRAQMRLANEFRPFKGISCPDLSLIVTPRVELGCLWVNRM